MVERHPDEDEPFSALAFKIMSDQHLGKLTYFRVYSGKITKGSPILNSTKDNKERVGKIYGCTPTSARSAMASVPARSCDPGHEEHHHR